MICKNSDSETPDYSFQENIVSSCLHHLYSGKKTVLAASCGAGKTIISIEIIKKYKSKHPDARILILTHGQSVLRTQYFNVLKEYFEQEDVFILESENQQIILNKKIIVTLPHTIHKKSKNEIGEFDLIIFDEAHHFYLAEEGMVQDILGKTKHTCELLLTGTPSKFIDLNKEKNQNEYEIISISSCELLEKKVISDLHILLIESEYYNFELGDYQYTNELIKRRIDVNLTKNVLIEASKEIYSLEKETDNEKSILNIYQNIKKMMIVCLDEQHAFEVKEILKEFGFNTILSTHSYDIKSEEIENFKTDPNIQVLVVVQRGILGFNYPELQCVIDLSLTLNPDRIFQMMNRAVRVFENRRKIFVKVMPKNIIELAEVSVSCASALSVKDVYEHYSGNYKNMLVPIITNRNLEKNRNTGNQNAGEKTKTINIPSFNVMERIFKNKDINEIVSQYAWTTFEITKNKLLKKHKSWTLQECKDEALKYKSMWKWRENNYSSYNAAYQNGWIEECSSHMHARIQTFWTPELCEEDAKKYKTKLEWRKGSNSYKFARKIGREFIEKCCAHMDIINIQWTRKRCLEDAKKYTTKYEWKQSSSGYEAAKRRGGDFFEECCKHMVIKKSKWTRKRCLEDAKKYNSKNEWRKCSSGYDAAKRRGDDFFEECCKHMVIKKPNWTPELCEEDAKKYNTKLEWRKGSNSYQFARKIGREFIEKCCAHMVIKKSTWTRERCLEDAKKYTHKYEWEKSSSGYDAAKRIGGDFFEECCAHMVIKKSTWTRERLLEDAKKYNTKLEWRKSSSGYDGAKRRGGDFFEECCQHMKKPEKQSRKSKWTRERCQEDAKKYSSKHEWAQSSSGYAAARRKGDDFFEECCQHMKKPEKHSLRKIKTAS